MDDYPERRTKMDVHKLRKEIDGLIYQTEDRQKGEIPAIDYGRALSLVRTKLQEAKMWAGKMLEAESKPLPKEYRDYCPSREDETGRLGV